MCFVYGKFGVLVEDKGQSFVLYWCGVLYVVFEVCVFVEWYICGYIGYWLQLGDYVVEFVFEGSDKGCVLCWLMFVLFFCDWLLVFFGDDFIDEYGFGVVNDLYGWSVFVGVCEFSVVVFVLLYICVVYVWLCENVY